MRMRTRLELGRRQEPTITADQGTARSGNHGWGRGVRAVAVGCGVLMAVAGARTVQADGTSTATHVLAAAPGQAPGAVQPGRGGLATNEPYMLLNQRWNEGFASDGVDIEDVDALFWAVFSRLPDDVHVYPTENYYYFQLYTGGKQVWGNIRLPSGRREAGVLSFGYSEFNEFLTTTPTPRLTGSKFFTLADGLRVERGADDFTWTVSYKNKVVTFHMLRIEQTPPKRFKLGADEIFIQRTFDESGNRFFLLFNTARNYFFWVLDEQEGLSDVLDLVKEDLFIGRRSGFAFWKDAAHDDRKVLVAVRSLNVSRNDYYDGPFDQLADNYADETKVAKYMVLAAPSLRGRIDKYGYYTDREQPMRVALSSYYSYLAVSDLFSFLDRAKASDDIYQYISRRGIPVPTQPTAGVEAEGVPATRPDDHDGSP